MIILMYCFNKVNLSAISLVYKRIVKHDNTQDCCLQLISSQPVVSYRYERGLYEFLEGVTNLLSPLEIVHQPLC